MKLQPQECVELNLQLQEGGYLLRSPQLKESCKFYIAKGEGINRCNVQVSCLGEEEFVLKEGKQCIHLINDFDKEVVMRLEHTVSRRDILTAAYVSSLPLFRQLFPEEVLSPEQLVAISNIVLFSVHIYDCDQFYKEKNDAQAFKLLYNYFQALEQYVEEHGGAVIKNFT